MSSERSERIARWLFVVFYRHWIIGISVGGRSVVCAGNEKKERKKKCVTTESAKWFLWCMSQKLCTGRMGSSRSITWLKHDYSNMEESPPKAEAPPRRLANNRWKRRKMPRKAKTQGKPKCERNDAKDWRPTCVTWPLAPQFRSRSTCAITVGQLEKKGLRYFPLFLLPLNIHILPHCLYRNLDFVFLAAEITVWNF